MSRTVLYLASSASKRFRRGLSICYRLPFTACRVPFAGREAHSYPATLHFSSGGSGAVADVLIRSSTIIQSVSSHVYIAGGYHACVQPYGILFRIERRYVLHGYFFSHHFSSHRFNRRLLMPSRIPRPAIRWSQIRLQYRRGSCQSSTSSSHQGFYHWRRLLRRGHDRWHHNQRLSSFVFSSSMP